MSAQVSDGVMPDQLEPIAEAPAPVQPTRKQGVSIYTMMLVVSFICVLTACILLFLELRRWSDGGRPWDTGRAAMRLLETQAPVLPGRLV